jgi:hypothetical protein
VELADRPALRTGIENALRTLMALVALDPKSRAAGARVESLERDGLRLLAYRQAGLSLVAHAGDGLLVLASDEARLIDFVRAPTPATPLVPPEVASADQFVWIDPAALRAWLSRHRDAILDRDPAAELDQLVALLDLFESAHATNHFDSAAGLFRQRFGLTWKPTPGAR